MGRPRSTTHRDLPDNLIPRRRRGADGLVTYWYWRDPRDGKEKSLLCPDDRATAIQRARELNALVAVAMAGKIVTDLAASPQRQDAQFNVFATAYLGRQQKRVAQGRLAPNTLRSRKSLINAAIERFGTRGMQALARDVAAISAFLGEIEEAGKGRTAQAMRSTLIDLFREAHSTGFLAPDIQNPAALTRAPTVDVQRARLTLEDYLAIWPHCEALGKRIGAWHPNAVLLAMLTAQRREDLSIMHFKRGREWDAAWIAFQRGEQGHPHPYPFVEDDLLWIVQQKTGNLVRIPLSLRLDALGITLGEVVDRCRTSIASRFLLHHSVPFGNAPLGSQIHPDTISRQFAVARQKSALDWTGRTPPTFHELRSLSERLYRDQGINTQTLLGHRHARMTEVYNDPRGAEWGTVKTA